MATTVQWGPSRHGNYHCELCTTRPYTTVYSAATFQFHSLLTGVISRLMEVHQAIADIPLVLHGTHEVSDGLFRLTKKYGMVKINVNRTVLDEYTGFVAENAGKLELTILKMRAVDVYVQSITRFMTEVLNSAGKG